MAAMISATPEVLVATLAATAELTAEVTAEAGDKS